MPADLSPKGSEVPSNPPFNCVLYYELRTRINTEYLVRGSNLPITTSTVLVRTQFYTARSTDYSNVARIPLAVLVCLSCSGTPDRILSISTGLKRARTIISNVAWY